VSIHSEIEATDAIERWFAQALSAVDPTQAVKSVMTCLDGGLVVNGQSVPLRGRLFVAAIGKAAQAMAQGAIAVCGDSIDAGFILTKDGHLTGPTLDRFEAYEAAHPVPDERCAAAAERLLNQLGALGEGDVVLALISGGGSALLEAPLPGVTLSDVARTTDLLLRAGAPIQHLNIVRIPLSRVKGGGLRRASPGARFVTLILSDVLGNDTRVIASGPTVSTDLTGAGALGILDQYDLTNQVPPSVIDALNQTRASTDDSVFDGDIVAIVGDNASAVEAFGRAANDDGVTHEVIWRAREGEATELAVAWVKECLNVSADIDLLLGGGEATVTVNGDGVGGRNTEFALAAALELERQGRSDWAVASLATDGQDALTGVAGAIATVETLEHARACDIDPVDALARNDSLAVFRAAGGCVEPGPTGTNVNDLYIALRIRT
jgi:glycerate 2-kinase